MSTSESRTTSSSRLSQFGLYRTIDARTEEFLRLSRKRQIRQGCACAVVSTAITVTVVVTVLLVYEYSINPVTNTTRKFTRKPNWLGLFNDSTMESKFIKANINIDPTTLKLLPLLLKALNHNSYLANVLEDPSQSSTSDGAETTEFPYERNIFTDTKNWIKTPSSKLHGFEHKNSPMIPLNALNKNHIANDEYGKAKKIKDYQKMFTYFNKIVEAATLSPDDEIKTDNVQHIKATREPAKIRTSSNNIPLNINNVGSQKSGSQTSSEGGTNKNCQCLKKVCALLKKLIASLQEIIPNIITQYNNSCNDTNDTERIKTVDFKKNFPPMAVPQSKNINEIVTDDNTSSSIPASIASRLSTASNVTASRMKTKTEKSSFINKYFKGRDTTEKNDFMHESFETDLQDFILNKIMNSSYRRNTYALKSHNTDKSAHVHHYRQPLTTLRSSTIPTDSSLTKTTTEAMENLKIIIPNHKKMNTSTGTIVAVTTSNRDIVQTSSIDKTTLPIVNDFGDDDFETTIRPIIDDIEKLDIHGIALLKGKLLPLDPSKRNDTIKISENDKHNVTGTILENQRVKIKEPKKLHTELVQQGTLEVIPDNQSSNPEYTEDIGSKFFMDSIHTLKYTQGLEHPHQNFTTEKAVSLETTTTKTETVKTYPCNEDKEHQSNLDTATVKDEDNKRSDNHLTHLDDSVIDDDDNEIRNSNGDIQDLEVLNEAVESVAKLNNRLNKDKSLLPNFDFAAGTGSDLDTISYISKPYSMLPGDRPTYLEINRNDWKQDNHDYHTGDNIPYDFS